MNRTTLITGAAAVAAAAALIGTGAALSSAATGAATSTPSATSSPSTDQRGGVHTPVTGDELAKVTAAVKAEDAAVTVVTVQKDEDGSYDVHGTKAGARVRLDVSADLKTITTGRGPGGDHGRGGGVHTPVTGDELAKVTAAVTAEDAAVTVVTVQKDEDGSYDVNGTKAGAPSASTSAPTSRPSPPVAAPAATTAAAEASTPQSPATSSPRSPPPSRPTTPPSPS